MPKQIHAQRSHTRHERHDDMADRDELDALIAAAVGAQALRDSQTETILQDIDEALAETPAES